MVIETRSEPVLVVDDIGREHRMFIEHAEITDSGTLVLRQLGCVVAAWTAGEWCKIVPDPDMRLHGRIAP